MCIPGFPPVTLNNSHPFFSKGWGFQVEEKERNCRFVIGCKLLSLVLHINHTNLHTHSFYFATLINKHLPAVNISCTLQILPIWPYVFEKLRYFKPISVSHSLRCGFKTQFWSVFTSVSHFTVSSVCCCFDNILLSATKSLKPNPQAKLSESLVPLAELIAPFTGD